ncbi:MAG: acyltransferase [Alphaproteobacteria bacterium]|nr:acyltransferase [Alphaproteobacteria bacterium]
MTPLDQLRDLIAALRAEKKARSNRHVSLGDLLTEREDTARFLGFGKGATCYNNVLVLGEVTVGEETWIGPNVILDGSGGLEIGHHCSISAGVQIYTHHTVKWATSFGKEPVERKPTRIGSGVYIGPNAVIQMGVTIGDRAVVGAMAFVNRDVPSGAKAWGTPAKLR